MFKYLISGASEVHPRYADFIFNSFRSPENGLSRYFEMRNLKCSLLPGLPIFPLSTLFFSLKMSCMCRSRGGGGGGVGGPDPIPGKSQVLSNSIEISILTPLVNSWTPPRIPGKFWTKKPQNKHKKIKAVFSPLGLDPPPLRDKKIWICACIDHSTAHTPPPPGLTQCQKELYGYVCTLAELSTNHRGPHGGGGGGGG